VELSAVFGFAAVALAMIAVPGPDWAYVLAAGTRNHVVWPVVSGIAIGYALITAVVALGVGPLIATRPLALTALTAVGASTSSTSVSVSCGPAPNPSRPPRPQPHPRSASSPGESG
jgi:arginine exporter protein ArgO